MNVLITGADRGLGLALTEKMLTQGFTVFAGQYLSSWGELEKLAAIYPDTLKIISLDVASDASFIEAAKQVSNHTDKLDAIIGSAAIHGWNDDVVAEFTDTQMMTTVYNVNTIGNVRLVEHFLPLLKNGTTRKICFVSSEAGSTAESTRETHFWYTMTKTALNHYAKILHNRLRKEDFKFRLYHPGWMKSYMHGEFINDVATYEPSEAANFAFSYFFTDVVNEDELVLYTFDKKIMAF